MTGPSGHRRAPVREGSLRTHQGPHCGCLLPAQRECHPGGAQEEHHEEGGSEV